MINIWFDSSSTVARTVTIVLLLFAFLQNSAAKKRQHSIVASNAAVATNHGQCSKIGINVLHQGGNAIDAYVAVALCLGVVNPGSSGLGGGSFAVVKMASGKEIAYDFREVASLRATEVTTFYLMRSFSSCHNMRFKISVFPKRKHILKVFLSCCWCITYILFGVNGLSILQ